MDKRSWPWKKKSSEKAVTIDSPAATLSSLGGNQVDQENAKSVNYVQISAESYAQLTAMEDEVKFLNDKLTCARSEITTKEELVKQHAKVAEEAVSGWEKAEAEALALKQQLESVTLLKLTAEEQGSQLDSALKECMKQIRSQWEQIRSELEAKIDDFEQELLKASAENAALSQSFQERTNVLIQVSDEKTQADALIEVLKSSLQSCDREIDSLKYELHIVSKELEIRNAEKNMSIRSAEVANKQHAEDVKKITKLEAECQRLRGLVRKKLPGPAALAQMKLEVENLGLVYGEPRVRRSSPRSCSPHFAPAPDFAYENFQQFQKENEFLTARLLSMEEETKMLREALSKRNGELQASRNLCAKTVNRLCTIESQILVLNRQTGPSKPDINLILEASLNESNLPSMSSMSEDGIDEEGSCLESGDSTLSEFSNLNKEKEVGKAKKTDKSSHMDLMDDFLEMERFACLSTETDKNVILPISETGKAISENADTTPIVQNDGGKGQSKLPFSCTGQLEKLVSSKGNNVLLSELQSRIALLFQSQPVEPDLNKVLEEINYIVQHVPEDLPLNSSSCIIEENQSANATNDQQQYPEDAKEIADSDTSLEQISTSFIDTKHTIDQNLKNAIS
ncbi:putative filament-like plant protein [Dioscorea sansibarensis]